ncbi:hypothetical protein FRY97_08200 [Phaeodactylibacter luteus]|uniref:Uncharacterized protein n=1 Tax=Phaeodactylibacter luteus TaxID=1564516 RepID=A0A5C6RN51_9BACT|nr:hypothetical protein FRY97_08200 [Phaeodactylibacter luteus]
MVVWCFGVLGVWVFWGLSGVVVVWCSWGLSGVLVVWFCGVLVVLGLWLGVWCVGFMVFWIGRL